MLVQNFLREYGLQKLIDDYSIKVTKHDDGRIILNYDQLDSPKFDPIVKECRGLCLDKDFNLVARGFNRFFNLGESHDEFNWDNFSCYEKIDGSFILYYYWKNNWHINTRGSFGEVEVFESGYTWKQLFNTALSRINYRFDSEYTYVFELCSPYNQVVTYYSEPQLFLTAVFMRDKERSFLEFEELPFSVPRHWFKSEAELLNYLEQQPGQFEGFVLKDNTNNRIKIKNKKYVELHHLHNNGNICNNKNILPFVLSGEQAEVVSYFPWVEPYVTEVTNKINTAKAELQKLWDNHSHKDQKNFAISIKHHPLSGILFNARKNNDDWRKLHKYESILLKWLENQS